MTTVRYTLTRPYPMNPNFIRIETDRRLQHSGRDVYLYANNDFRDADLKGASELLNHVLTQVRRNNSGVERLHVSPFTMGFQTTSVVQTNDIERMFLTAAHVAGMATERV